MEKLEAAAKLHRKELDRTYRDQSILQVRAASNAGNQRVNEHKRLLMVGPGGDCGPFLLWALICRN